MASCNPFGNKDWGAVPNSSELKRDPLKGFSIQACYGAALVPVTGGRLVTVTRAALVPVTKFLLRPAGSCYAFSLSPTPLEGCEGRRSLEQ